MGVGVLTLNKYMITWGIIYHRLQTVNLYRIALKHVRVELILQTRQVKARTFIKRSSSLFVVLEREISCWKQSSWMRSIVSTMVKTYSCGYLRDLESPSATRLCHLFSTITGGGCSVVLVVSPLVSVVSRRRKTTMYNLYIIGLVHRRFPESVAHVQTVDTKSHELWPTRSAAAQGGMNVHVYTCTSRGHENGRLE